MDVTAILVSIVLVIIVGYFIIHAATKIAKIALILFLIVLVSSTFFGVNLWNDMTELKEQFPNARKLLLLDDNGVIRAGFETSIVNSKTIVSFVDEEKLSELQDLYKDGDLDAMKSTYFKVIFIKPEALDDLKTSFNNMNLTSTQVFIDLRAADTFDRMITKLIEHENLPNTASVRSYVADNLRESNISTDVEMRGVLFAQLFSSALQEDSLFFLNQQRLGNMVMYPESITFKFAQYIPEFIAQRVFETPVNT